MAITMEQLRELYRDVARIQTDIQDIESHARSTRNGSRNNVLDQRDRDTVAMVTDAHPGRYWTVDRLPRNAMGLPG